MPETDPIAPTPEQTETDAISEAMGEDLEGDAIETEAPAEQAEAGTETAAAAEAPAHEKTLNSALSRLESIEAKLNPAPVSDTVADGDDPLAKAEAALKAGFEGDDEGQQAVSALVSEVRNLRKQLAETKVNADDYGQRREQAETLQAVLEVGELPGFGQKIDNTKANGGMTPERFSELRAVVAKAEEYQAKAKKAGELMPKSEAMMLAVAKLQKGWLVGKAAAPKTPLERRQALIRPEGTRVNRPKEPTRHANQSPHSKAKQAELDAIAESMNGSA